MQLFQGHEGQRNVGQEKLARRIEARRKQLSHRGAEDFLPKKDVQETQRQPERDQLTEDQKAKLRSVAALDQDDLEYILREGADSRTIKKLTQQAGSIQAGEGTAAEERARRRERELYDRQTREIKRMLLQEQAQREDRLESFLDSQHAELQKCMKSEGEHDPERILEIRKKR